MPKFCKCVRDCDAVIEYYKIDRLEELRVRIDVLQVLYFWISSSKELLTDRDKLKELRDEMDRLEKLCYSVDCSKESSTDMDKLKKLFGEMYKLKKLYFEMEKSKELPPDMDKLKKLRGEMKKLEELRPEIVKKDVKIPKGWIFYYHSGIECCLSPIKKSSETNVTFDVKDKKDFKQGFWNNVRDAAVLKQLKLKELGNLSNYRIELSAPKSCFEEI